MPRQRPAIPLEIIEQLDVAVRASRQSIAGLAEALAVERSTLYKWLDGTNAISRAKLVQLCNLIHLPATQRRAQFIGRGYVPERTDQDHVSSLIPRQLRAPTRDFVGRGADMAQVVAALQRVAHDGTTAIISGVRGMGGIGKTELAYRIAQRVAHAFPDGQIVLDLQGMHPTPMDPADALRTVLRAFDPTAQLPDDVLQLIGRYRSLLTGKRVLILADDARDAAQVQPLLPPVGCAVLVTSRQRWLLDGMLVIDLATLTPDEADQLLQAICPRLRDAAPPLAALCGYLPLALRISASLLAINDTIAITDYLANLAQTRLTYLRDPARPDDPQASVDASLALSYRALPADVQAGLLQLGVFSDSFDHAAAAAVINLPLPVARAHLGVLRRHSLIEWDATQERYRLHDLVRAFAVERLDDPAPPHQRHAQHFLQRAESRPPHGVKAQRPWVATMAREHPQLRAAFTWLRATEQQQLALRLATALGPFWLAHDHLHEGFTALQTMLTPTAPGDEALRATASLYAGMLARVRGDLDAAQPILVTSRTLFQWQEDEAGYAEATFQLGLVVADRSDKTTAADLFHESRLYFEQVGRWDRVGVLHSSLGRMALDRGDTAAAQDHFARSETLLRASDDDVELAWLLVNRARHAAACDDAPQALAYVTDAVDHFRTLHHQQGLAWALLRRGTIQYQLGDVSTAHTTLDESLTLFTQLANVTGQAMAHQVLAQVHLDHGESAAAYQHAQAAVQRYADPANAAGISFSLITLAAFTEYSSTHRALLLGAATAFLDGTGVNLAAPEYAWYARIVQNALPQLPDAAWTAAWEIGDALSPAEAVAHALARASPTFR